MGPGFVLRAANNADGADGADGGGDGGGDWWAGFITCSPPGLLCRSLY